MTEPQESTVDTLLLQYHKENDNGKHDAVLAALLSETDATQKMARLSIKGAINFYLSLTL